MASRTMYSLKHVRPERLGVGGTFSPNGASQPVNASNEGSGGNGTSVFSVARNGVGDFTVTFADPYKNVDSVVCQLLLAAPVSGAALTVTAKGTNSFRVVYSVAGTPTELAAAGTTKIAFMAQLSNSGVG